MPESQTPQNDKSKKSRSLGAFLLFLTVLIAVLVVVGSRRYEQQKELTQDHYEWELYHGNIKSQVLTGENLIEGKFAVPLEGKPEFKVRFAKLDENASRFRELKAIPKPGKVPVAELREAVESRRWLPLEAKLLLGYRSAGEEGGKELPTEQHLIVKVLTGTDKASAEPAEPGSAAVRHLIVEDDPAGAAALLADHGLKPEAREFDLTSGTRWTDSGNLATTLLVYYGPWILIFVVFLLFMRQMRSQGGAGGVMSFGRSRAQLYSKESHTNVTFDDVAGATEAKDEVREVVEFLKNPSRFTRIGGRIPRGVLLVGPPGCGKTLLAKAIAGEAEVPFFSISGSDFVEMFVGVGASRVRDLFKQARENSPCIIFLDEIDAVGRRRGSGLGGGHDEREQTLNAILVEMDGFGTDEGIIVIAATNRPDVLDPALLRPGRFDREVVIDLPDVEGRDEILRVHLKKVKTGPDADVKTLARSTPGYSGADLAAIINEAAIRAALAKREEITMEDLEEARDKVRYGRQKRSRKLEVEDKKITAYHEAGHAVVATAIPEVDRPHKVTIVPRGRALGATMVLPDKESYHMQKRRMLGQLALLFGGRVAEAEFCGDISAGASDDIQRATDLARAMVSELGMSEKIGPVNYSERQGSDFLGTELMRGRQHSEETAREIDREVHQLLEAAYKRAEGIVREKREAVERLAQALLAYETVSGEEIVRLMKGASVEGLRTPAPEAPPASEPRRAEKPAAGKPAPGEKRKGELPGLSPA